jgi:hypothetical protein
MIDKHSSQELSGLIKSKFQKDGTLQRSEADNANEWYNGLLARIKEEKRVKGNDGENQDSVFYSFLKNCNLTFGILLFLLSNYGFLY